MLKQLLLLGLVAIAELPNPVWSQQTTAIPAPSATEKTRKSGLQGFNAIAFWGDDGKGKAQTIWVDDVSVTLGGPVKIAFAGKANPYDAKAITANTAAHQLPIIYTKANAPVAPRLEDLPLKESVSQFGIVWVFEKPARVGQFINGDWYVVGPATIRAIDPKPLYGQEIPKIELDALDKERRVEYRVRNGFMLNPPARMKVAYDSGVRNYFDPSLIQKLPVTMKAGDSLANVNLSFPKVSFGEDEQTAYGDCWTGAKVVFAGHSGIDVVTGVGRNQGRGNP